jgi:uncharacterized NAD-dependent epimerase/dehydratase family protein
VEPLFIGKSPGVLKTGYPLVMEGRAVVLAPGAFATDRAKTAHGLVRGSDRFEVVAVIDSASAGRDAGEILDGRRRDVPVYASLSECLQRAPTTPDTCIVGVAMGGGFMPPEVRALLIEAAEAGLTLVNGLHELASEDAAISAAAARGKARIVDLRRPRPVRELRFWTGDIARVRAPRLALLGTDCAVGKRTTARLLVQACREAGLAAEMVYTGQTGWMQGGRFGFILDATPNDFVAGELEGAVVACDEQARPDLIVIEGQSSLRNPSGPCGAELLVSAGARAVVLQHAPGRACFKGHTGWVVPSLLEELELIRLYGAQVLAITLNGDNVTADALLAEKRRLTAQLGLPVIAPFSDGVTPLLPLLRRYLQASAGRGAGGSAPDSLSHAR